MYNTFADSNSNNNYCLVKLSNVKAQRQWLLFFLSKLFNNNDDDDDDYDDDKFINKYR